MVIQETRTVPVSLLQIVNVKSVIIMKLTLDALIQMNVFLKPGRQTTVVRLNYVKILMDRIFVPVLKVMLLTSTKMIVSIKTNVP